MPVYHKRPILGLDFDDLMIDFNRGLATWHNQNYGTDYAREQIVSYHLRDLWGCSLEEQNRRISEFYLSPEHRATQPVFGSREVLPHLEEQYEVVVISARPERIRPQTVEWLEEHFPQLVGKLHLTNRFGSGPELKKSEICQKLGVDAFVDDGPPHHQDVATVVSQTILFEAPWNRDYALRLPQRQRVRSWYGLAVRLA